jgi:mannosyltransferase
VEGTQGRARPAVEIVRNVLAVRWNPVGLVWLLPVGLAAVLALYRLDVQPMWWDEWLSRRVATAPRAEFIAWITGSEAYSGLYYILLRGWSKLGTDAVTLRLFSVILTVAAVGAAYALANRLFGRRVAVVASLLMATNSFVIRYAQETRAYSLAMLLVIVATYALVWASEGGGRRWLAYLAAGVGAAYAHLFSLGVIAAHAVRGGRTWLIVAAAIGVLAAPIAILDFAVGPPRTFITQPTIDDFGRQLTLLQGGLWQPGFGVAAIAHGAVGAIGLGAGLLRAERWRVVLVAAWAYLPIVGAFVLSYLLEPIFIARYLLFCTPALMLLTALGLARLGWLGIPVLAGLLYIHIQGLAWLYWTFQKPVYPPLP